MADQDLYTFEYDGKRFDLECVSSKDLEAWVDNWWAEHCQEEACRNGEIIKSEGEIITFRFSDDGETIDHKREKYPLEYEHYHGDYAEHNTHWGLS